VLISEVDLTCSRLLIYSGVRRIEADDITPRALQALAEADVDVKARDIKEPDG